MPSIAYLAEPLLRIAGMRITPAYNSRQVLSFSTGLSLKDMKTNVLRRIALPDGVKFTFPSWSPDGRTIALLRYVDGGVELWAVDVATGSGQGPDPAGRQRRARRDRLGAGRPPHPRLARPGRPGPGPDRAARPRRPRGPGLGRPGSQDRHLPGPQQERVRRGPLRLLRHVPDRARRRRLRGDPQARPGRDLRHARRGPGRCSTSSPAGSSGPIPIPSPPTGSPIRWRSGTWTADLVKVLADLPTEEGVPLNGVPKGPRSIAGWSTSRRRSSGPRPWTRAIPRRRSPSATVT